MNLFCYAALILRVIDGDTVVTEIDMGLNVTLTKQHVRLLGIDTPELRGAEREAGLAARDALVSLAPRGTTVTICAKGRDNFGRVLGHLWVGDVDVAEWLTEQGHAK